MYKQRLTRLRRMQANTNGTVIVIAMKKKGCNLKKGLAFRYRYMIASACSGVFTVGARS